MIELRWILDKKKAGGLEPIFEDWTLQYRFRILGMNASGALEPTAGWSDWQDVPYVSEK